MIPSRFANPQSFYAYLNWRRKQGFDTVIHVVGAERNGKSSFVIDTAMRVSQSFRVQDAYVHEWKDVPRVLRLMHERFEENQDRWLFFFADEATNILDNLDHSKRENKEGKKLFRQWGYMKALTFLVDPDNKLDRYVSHRATFRVVIRRRGRATIKSQRRDRNYEKPPWFATALELAYPAAEDEWPETWAEYLPLKLANMGMKIKDTAENVELAGELKLAKRDKMKREIAQLRNQAT